MCNRPYGGLGLSATCTWLACRIGNLPVTIEEVTRAYEIPRETLLHASSFLRFELELVVPPADLHAYCRRFIHELGLDQATTDEAEATVMNLPPEDRSGRSPMVLTAAIIYTALQRMGKGVALSELAREFGVSEVAIRLTSRMIAAKHATA